MPSKPTILFVPGAWHSEFHTAPCLPYFSKLGYSVKVLTLANLGAHEGIEPKPTSQDSADKIHAAMREEAQNNRDFVIIAHSAGGLTCGMATNDFLKSASPNDKSRLKYIIFLASFIRTSRHIISHWHHMDFEKGLSTVLKPEEVFYNDMSLDESKPYCDALQPMVLGPRPDEIENLWHEVPRTFVIPLRDMSLLPDKQKVEAREQGFEVVEMDAGHCPFISVPEEFVGVVDGILREKVGV